jgi:hypothetical protein
LEEEMKDIEILDIGNVKMTAREFVKSWQKKNGDFESVFFAKKGAIITAEDDVAEEVMEELDRLGLFYHVIGNY